MLTRSVSALLVLMIAHSVSAEDVVLMRFQGRSLTPGDRFTVSSTIQYAVFDANRKAAEKDGSKAVDASMIEFREPSAGKAVWTLTVPKDGQYSGVATRFPFLHTIRSIPGRITTYLVSVVISRSTVAPDGKPVSFTREQTFPVTLTEDNVPKDLCVVFEGGAAGSLTMGVREKCSDSVAPSPNSRSTLSPQP